METHENKELIKQDKVNIVGVIGGGIDGEGNPDFKTRQRVIALIGYLVFHPSTGIVIPSGGHTSGIIHNEASVMYTHLVNYFSVYTQAHLPYRLQILAEDDSLYLADKSHNIIKMINTRWKGSKINVNIITSRIEVMRTKILFNRRVSELDKSESRNINVKVISAEGLLYRMLNTPMFMERAYEIEHYLKVSTKRELFLEAAATILSLIKQGERYLDHRMQYKNY